MGIPRTEGGDAVEVTVEPTHVRGGGGANIASVDEPPSKRRKKTKAASSKVAEEANSSTCTCTCTGGCWLILVMGRIIAVTHCRHLLSDLVKMKHGGSSQCRLEVCTLLGVRLEW
jgi:hypothetical protein